MYFMQQQHCGFMFYKFALRRYVFPQYINALESRYSKTPFIRNMVIRNLVVRNMIIRNLVVRNMIIRNLVIRNLVIRIGLVLRVNLSRILQKLTCLEIIGYRIKYSTVLWLVELKIRRGRKV